MADRTTNPAVANLKRAARTLAVVSVLAASPAAAQTSPAEGTPPTDDKAAGTLKRMEVNQATRMRDLMTMISLASSKKVAISVGAIEASADGTSIRLKNIVIVDRQGLSIQVLPLTEILDLDQRHFIPRHFRIVTYSDIVVASLPPMAIPIIQAMGVKSLAGRTSFEFKFDESAGTLEIRSFSFEWSGVAQLAFNLQLTNVPPLNDMILLAGANHGVSSGPLCGTNPTMRGQVTCEMGDRAAYSPTDFHRPLNGPDGIYETPCGDGETAWERPICGDNAVDYTTIVMEDLPDGEGMQHDLVRNPDILAEISAEPGARVIVGFAAESHDLVAAARRKLERKGCDLLVANDISRTDAGFESDANAVTLVSPGGEVEELPLLSKSEVAERLLDRIEKLRRERA